MNLSEKEACYILTCIDSIGIKTVEKLREYTYSYAGIFDDKPENYEKVGIISKEQETALIRASRNISGLLEEMKKFIESGINMFCPSDKGYPMRLKNISDPPILLFVRGRLPADNQPAAAIIGARECSDYGISVAGFFAGELAKKGVNIVSGMAYGIDGAAAKGALKIGCDSFAVLGSGVNVCYPRENFRIYRMMSGMGYEDGAKGGIISEFHPQKSALALNFVMRNRLIAGLCDALLVIEAREKSGTSITVNYALDQGKEVFALPGRITDPLGRGCNKLIRDGATPLVEPQDVLSYLGIDEKAEKVIPRRDTSRLSGLEKLVFDQLREDPRHIEDIAHAIELDLREAAVILGNLELKKYAISSGGAYYRKA